MSLQGDRSRTWVEQLMGTVVSVTVRPVGDDWPSATGTAAGAGVAVGAGVIGRVSPDAEAGVIDPASPASEAAVIGRVSPDAEAGVIGRASPDAEAGVAGQGWPAAEAGVAALFAELRAVEARLSPWREDSDLRRLQRGEATVPELHPDLGEVLALARRAREVTGGWFDCELLTPLSSGIPDPTGLAKGWAVERATAALAAELVGQRLDLCVNAGGDIAVHCESLAGRPWLVGVQDPADGGAVLGALALHRGGVATSGAAARGPHVIDPTTARPVVSGGSVTVYGPSLTWADAWATAGYAHGAAATWLSAVLPDGYGAVVVDEAGGLTTVPAPAADR